MFFRWTALSRGLTCCGRDRRQARLLSPCPDRVCRRAQCAGASGPARTAFSTRRAGRGMRLRGTVILDRPSGFSIAPGEASPFRCRLTPGGCEPGRSDLHRPGAVCARGTGSARVQDGKAPCRIGRFRRGTLARTHRSDTNILPIRTSKTAHPAARPHREKILHGAFCFSLRSP